MNVMRHLGMSEGEATPPPTQRVVEVADPQDSLYAHGTGLFDRAVQAGQDVGVGDFAGTFHYIGEPERASERLFLPSDGMVLAHTNRGIVSRGELLALVVRDEKGGAK